MVSLTALVLPILLSAVVIFFASSVIHMALRYHNADYRPLANEDAVASVLRQGGLAPGQYVLPHCKDHAQMNTPEMQKKWSEGPIAVLYVKPSGPMQLGPFLGKWFAYTLVVSAVVAYLASAVLTTATPGLTVFRVVGTATWFAYSWQGPADSIWKGKPWICTAKDLFDGLVYGVLTGAVFACLWPHA